MKTILGGLALSVLLAGPVAAADLPARMPVKAPPPVVVMYNWTGCYIGGHVGYAWTKKTVEQFTTPIGASLDHDADGFLAGGQLGCNWQNDRIVFGIEGQAAWTDIDGDVSILGQTFGTTGFRTEADIIGSIAARLGVAVGATGQTLLFVKGGAAFIHEQFTATLGPLTAESDEKLRWGWMVGAGFEQAITNTNWSFKGEYNYSHFGTHDIDVCVIGATCSSYEIKQHVHLVKFGLNYRFGGGPVVARY